MEEALISVVTTLGINAIFLVLYLRALGKLESLGNRYLDFLERTIREDKIEENSKKAPFTNP